MARRIKSRMLYKNTKMNSLYFGGFVTDRNRTQNWILLLIKKLSNLRAKISCCSMLLLGRHLRIHFSSVQFSHSVVSDSLRPHELQHARPPCPSPTPGICSNSCPLSWRCHPAISSFVVLFSSCPQSLLASGSFPMSQLFT